MSRVIPFIFVLAFATGCEFLKNPTEPAPPAPANEIRYTAIGASDAIGIGASVPCLPFSACPTGTGYVQTIARQLETGGKSVVLMNLGLPGAVLGPDTQALGVSIGQDIFGNFLSGSAVRAAGHDGRHRVRRRQRREYGRVRRSTGGRAAAIRRRSSRRTRRTLRAISRRSSPASAVARRTRGS